MSSEIRNDTNIKNSQNIFTYGAHQSNHDNNKNNKNIEQVTSDFFEQLVENVADYFVKEGGASVTPELEAATEAFFDKLSLSLFTSTQDISLDAMFL